MPDRDALRRLLKEANVAMKKDVKTAVAKLESAYALAMDGGDADDAAYVAEELSRGWSRRKAFARSLHYARKSTTLAPEQKSGWATLAMTCELIATRTPSDRKGRRARALFRATAASFKKAASLSKDAEDKRWLLELAGDAARHGKEPAAP